MKLNRGGVMSVCLLACLTACQPSGSEQTAVRTSPHVGAFVEVSEQTGLVFEHFIGATGEYYLPEIMGSGAALLDYDGDGDLDVYLLQGALLDQNRSLADSKFPAPTSHWPGNRLYRNEIVPSGALNFTDVTDQAGVGHEGYGMGAAVGDYDNDGDTDLFVTNVGPNVLYRNNGDGTFADVTTKGLDDPRWSTSAAFLDYDNDGDLDLFFTNYVDFTVRGNKECFDATGVPDYCTPNAYQPVPDRLFRNDGGSFRDVTAQAGIGAAFGNGLGVACTDLNNDGRMDMFVANDGVANQLWMNLGGGKFENTALMAGAAYNADGAAEAGMGISAADFDGDGDEDVFMTHLAQETNTLYLNNGEGEFRDATNRYGLGAVSMPFTGFGMRWVDYDNDGRLDLFVANGAVTIVESLRGAAYPFQQTNQLFHAGADGRFEDVSAEAGEALKLSAVSRGAAFGDLDQDGDVDIVVSNNNGPAHVLLNQAGAHSLTVRLRGVKSNRDGYGARVALLHDGASAAWRRVHSDGSYLSASEAAVRFGLGGETGPQTLGVVWPSGLRERFDGLGVDQKVFLEEGAGTPWPE